MYEEGGRGADTSIIPVDWETQGLHTHHKVGDEFYLSFKNELRAFVSLSGELGDYYIKDNYSRTRAQIVNKKLQYVSPLL